MDIEVVYNKSEKPETKKVSMPMKAKKTLDGNIVVFDHDYLDIVVMPKKKKVVAFAKKEFGDHVYDAQDRFFKYLAKRGVIDPESIQGGNVYFSIQAKIPESKDYDSVKWVLFSIGKFMEQEKPFFEFAKQHEEEFEKWLTQPTPEESTEFDPERHAAEKGSIRPDFKYGASSIYRI